MSLLTWHAWASWMIILSDSNISSLMLHFQMAPWNDIWSSIKSGFIKPKLLFRGRLNFQQWKRWAITFQAPLEWEEWRNHLHVSLDPYIYPPKQHPIAIYHYQFYVFTKSQCKICRVSRIYTWKQQRSKRTIKMKRNRRISRTYVSMVQISDFNYRSTFGYLRISIPPITESLMI